MWGCLFETFRWDLKWDVLFETFETLQLKLFEMFDVSFKDKKVSINPEFSNHSFGCCQQ